MKTEFTDNTKVIKEIMKEFWKKDVTLSKLKPISIEPIWFYIKEEKTIISFINGFILNYGYCKIAEVTNIEVKEKYRGKGYSTELMTIFIKHCKRKKVDTISLRVNKDNKIAIKLYDKFGFKKDKEGMLMDLEIE